MTPDTGMDINAIAATADFELAARKQFRYPGANGQLNTEDLWRLTTLPRGNNGNALSNIAHALAENMPKTDSLAAFLSSETTPEQSEEYVQERLAIVLHIILKKREAANAAKESRLKAEKRERIAAIIQSKEYSALENSSVEELQALLQEL